MGYFLIEGGKRLQGVLKASGAKNAALPIMAATLMVKGDVYLERVPDITDVQVMIELLRFLGADVEYNPGSRMRINTDKVNTFVAPYELVKKIHASFDITGPLLARFKQAHVPLPGGCVIGYRGVNFHIDGFKNLGAEVKLEHGYIKAKAKRLKGSHIYIGRASVGATKNIITAACLAEGTTYLENAAREPEVVDLANFLNKMGAKITGAGTENIKVEGVNALRGKSYSIISDRIETGTYLLAGAITGGKVKVEDIPPSFLEAFLNKLETANVVVQKGENWIEVEGRESFTAVDIMTAPFPGYPTDLQAPIVSLLSIAKGISIIEETIFDGRFNYIAELQRMGAEIKVTDRTAVVCGVDYLTGAPVEAPDIRAGGALVLAGLVAKGQSKVEGIKYIDRGYEKIEEKLVSLGAYIKRVEE